MRRFYQGAAAVFLCLILSLSAFAATPETLIPGGNTIGLHLDTKGVSVVEISSESGKKAGVEKGDVIQRVNDVPVSSPQEVIQAVQSSQGAPLKLTLLRDGEVKSCTLAPQKTEKGWQLGLMVRDGINGIGTVTYYNTEDDSFGALGHGVNEGKNLLPMEEGSVLPAKVASVVKGKKGEPGALQGAVTAERAIGTIDQNTSGGIFGTMDCPQKTPLPVGKSSQVHEGKATILSNVAGTQIGEYAIEILEIHPRDNRNRNLLIKVTDSALLNTTGGIVQGMSGSPILQDGKLIGAVTHVLMDDPTCGYGIFIENMLNAAA